MGESDIMSHAISQERTRNYISQLKGSAVFKILAVASSFFSIPLMVRYLGQEQFGIWSTLLSVMSWIVFFDLGIGNGLRNKLAESLATNQIAEAANYISSGYSLIGLVSLLLFIIITISAYFIPWQKVFNTNSVPEIILRHTILATGFFVLLNFWLSLINQVLNAVQKTSQVVLGQFISNALALIFIYILMKTTDPSLPYLAIGYGLSLVAASLILSLIFYKERGELIPRASLESRHVRPILSLGVQFFTIQIAYLVIFMTDKIVITQLFGPQSVTQYDVVYRLFSLITLVHGLINTPLWSSYTDAYHREDFSWIKGVLHKQFQLFGLIVIAVIVMLLVAKSIIGLWIGHDFEISTPLVISMGAFVLVSAWNNIFGSILGGINKIRLGSFYTVVTAFLNIPLSYFFAIKLGIGIAGIIIGTIVSISISAIVSPLQVYYFIFIKQENKFISGILR